MHEAHVVYRKEAGAGWNLNPNAATVVPLGPVLAVADPATGRPKDLTHYYGAWVTPHAEPVQDVLRRAAELHPAKMLAGYLRGGLTAAREQAAAVYRALKEVGVPVQFVRYPREGHGFRERAHQVDLMKRIVAWFERHIPAQARP